MSSATHGLIHTNSRACDFFPSTGTNAHRTRRKLQPCKLNLIETALCPATHVAVIIRGQPFVFTLSRQLTIKESLELCQILAKEFNAMRSTLLEQKFFSYPENEVYAP